MSSFSSARTSSKVLLCLVTLVMASGIAQAAPDLKIRSGPLAAIDPDLSRVLDKATGQVRVIVTGQPHEGITEDRFTSRADASKALDLSAAPFFAEVERVAATTGGRVTGRWSASPAVALAGPATMVDRLRELESVTYVEEDKEDAIKLIEPMEPDSVEADNSTGRQMLQAEDIWALGFRGQGIKVSVIDTGLDPTHEAHRNADGSSRVSLWRDLVNTRPAPYDDHGHGTHVAATVLGNNLFDDPTWGRFQEIGVAPEATLMVAKFLSGSGSGSFPNAIESIKWSYDNGADITSNSWGSDSCSAGVSVMAAVRQYTDLGMLSVFAAGNAGPSGKVGSPACGESALSVGAVDVNSVIASFSSRGPCSDVELGTPPRICPDVVAKGVAVRSAIPRAGATWGDPSGYRTWQGTSMATPHVAGAVALAEQMKRFYTGTGWDTAGRAEEQVFKLTALDLGPANEDNDYGWGLPQLLSIYALVNATNEANIVPFLSVSSPVVRQGDSTDLTFRVRNLGGAIASGPFQATLTAPDDTVTVLKSSAPSLGLLDAESVTHRLTVTGAVAPGDYQFRGTFNYTWTDPDNVVHEGSVDLSETIKVARVFVTMDFAGLPESAPPGVPQTVTFTASNTGNEDASSVVVEVAFPDDYLFVPGANIDPANLNTRYSNPAPSSVREDRNFGRVTLIYDVGTLAQGSSFSFTATIVPTTPGTYRTVGVAKFKDGAGRGFAQGAVKEQVVEVAA